ELNNILVDVMKWMKEPQGKHLWFWKDENIATKYNLELFSSLFRSLLIREHPPLFPVNLMLPLISKKPLNKTLDIIKNRLFEDNFKFCVYVLFYKELNKLLKDGKLEEVFPDGDGEVIIKKIAESKGEYLEELLFPVVSQEESRPEDDKPPAEEEESRSEDDQPQAENEANPPEEEKEPSKEEIISENLKQLMKDILERESFGNGITKAVSTSMDKGFEKGYENLQFSGELRGEISGVINFLCSYYERVVFLIDQLELFNVLEPSVKSKLIGMISELKVLGENNVLILFTTSPSCKKLIGSEYSKNYRETKLDLKDDLPPPSGEIDETKLKEIMIKFFSNDVYRKFKEKEFKEKENNKLFPFTEDALVELVKRGKGNPVKVLLGAGRVLAKGKEANFPELNKDRVCKFLESQ
ncbi:MAG: hypothetical protein KAS39_03095, partial [Actinomycetia bacterium]|nr:hypothetical protein [Actinomycetes bacterium]